MDRLQGLLGIALILGLAVLASNNRRRINLRLVCSGIALQVAIPMLIFHVGPVARFFQVVGQGIGKLEEFARAGAAFESNFADDDIHHCMNTAWLLGGVMTGAAVSCATTDDFSQCWQYGYDDEDFAQGMAITYGFIGGALAASAVLGHDRLVYSATNVSWSVQPVGSDRVALRPLDFGVARP